MKVALIHDYLREYDDAAQLLQVLHRMYPAAPVYTAFVDKQRLGEAIAHFSGWDIRTTPAQGLPGIARHYQTWRALLPYFWESLDLSDYDLVISSSGDYLSQAVLTGADTLHVSYCHTPPRYLWQPAQSPRWWSHPVDTSLRQYDFYASQRVDRFVTNSERVARRIRKFYRRSAEVISPPVNIRGKGEAGDKYYLYVGNLTRQEQVDLAVEACTRLDRPLWVVGTGADGDRLRRLAGATIHFVGAVAAEAMPGLYADAKALIFPSAEADFGVVPVAAMGHGIPVIACERSGMREIMLDYRTGVLFAQPTVESLCGAIAQFEKLRFSSQACIERAQEFATSVFTTKLEWLIAQALDEHKLRGAIVL